MKRADAWSLALRRDDLTKTELRDEAVPDIGPGEVLLRVDRVGLTANNVTYALMGEAMHYWDFFPTTAGWGLVPLWGFGEVVGSETDGVTVGSRVYGYFPSASHVVVKAGGVDETRFKAVDENRAKLPSPYNSYTVTAHDPAYEADREDLLILFRPLFFTSYMLADQLEDNAFYGASTLVMSSASSKTAYGAAFLLQGQGAEMVGLTSPGNVAFTESLGCYDRVVAYDAISELEASRPTVYLDVAGSADLRARLREHLGDHLVRDVVIGVTHQEQGGGGGLAAGGTEFFFAPNQMRKRTGDWGRPALDQRFAEAWLRFAPTAEQWVDVVPHEGPAALRDVWLEVLAGTTSPRVGHVIQL
jgi:NADPH:quinone reductase-like Zn-dependent oxidoreductase